MATNDYEFMTRWRVRGTPAEAYDLLVDAQSYLRWWPQVYLKVMTITQPGEHGLGAVNDLHTRSKLSYTLRSRARVTETHYPAGFTIEGTGDFLGRDHHEESSLCTTIQAQSSAKALEDRVGIW